MVHICLLCYLIALFRDLFPIKILHIMRHVRCYIPSITLCNFSHPRLCDMIEHDVHVQL